MGETSKISWCDATWNSIIGCSHVSPGCQNCYAETLALRFGWSKKPWGAQNATENVQLRPKRLGEPLKWAEPKKIFVNSLSDVFHELVPFAFVDQIWAVMAATPRHTFQILTKRPERMLEYLSQPNLAERIAGAAHATSAQFNYPGDWAAAMNLRSTILPNVWLGVSVEDQRRADERIPLLLQTPAAVRFLSCEPLLGELNLDRWLEVQMQTWCDEPERGSVDGWRVKSNPSTGLAEWRPALDWVIVGGESGRGYRPMDLEWARSIRDQCQAAGVALWFKQTGGPKPGTGEELDGCTWHEFPVVSR